MDIDSDGDAEASIVVTRTGALVLTRLGLTGMSVRTAVGLVLGGVLSREDGDTVGCPEGKMLGKELGELDGANDGSSDGCILGQ